MGRKLISDGGLIAIFLLAAISLLPSACGIQVSVSSDAGGLTEQIEASDGQAVNGRTVITTDGLSHSIEGSGYLRDSHWVSNSAWAYAGVGVDIRNAASYSYDYSLSPGNGYYWPASKYPWVEASETLDVLNAQYINAYATAYNANGDVAMASTEVFDAKKKASLRGYANSARASATEVSASQTGGSASAPNDTSRPMLCPNRCNGACLPWGANQREQKRAPALRRDLSPDTLTKPLPRQMS